MFYSVSGSRNKTRCLSKKALSSSDSFFKCGVVGTFKFFRVVECPQDVVSRFVLFEQGGTVFGAEHFPQGAAGTAQLFAPGKGEDSFYGLFVADADGVHVEFQQRFEDSSGTGAFVRGFCRLDAFALIVFVWISFVPAFAVRGSFASFFSVIFLFPSSGRDF